MFLNEEIAAAAKAGNLSKVVAHSRHFATGHATPTIDTYNSVLSAFAEHGLLEEVWALLSDMEASGLKPQVEAYNQLLHVSGLRISPPVP